MGFALSGGLDRDEDLRVIFIIENWDFILSILGKILDMKKMELR